MILRSWHTRIDESRAAEYEAFARQRSVPMFRASPGFAGCLFGGQPGARVVITLWDDRGAIEALENSERYKDTVAAIAATGFLEGDSSVDVYELQGAMLDPKVGDPRRSGSNSSISDASRTAW